MEDIDAQNLQGQIDQLKSMIPMMSFGQESNGGVALTSSAGESGGNPNTEDSQEFTFESANDSNVVVKVKNRTVVEGEETVNKSFITIGVYYV